LAISQPPFPHREELIFTGGGESEMLPVEAVGGEMRGIRCWCAAALLACTPSGRPVAGGWDRADQGVDLLFDPGKLTF
jgi:hypothetical protein